MKYTHLSRDERYQIAALLLARKTPTQIAQQLKRNKSTISREIKRNGSSVFGCYRAHMACERAALRAPNSRNAKPVCPARLALALNYVRCEQWSPEQSAAKSGISHETLYRHIYADKAQGGDLWTHLRHKRRVRRHRARGHERRGRLPDIRPISQRPAHIEARARVGHFEIDSVVCGQRAGGKRGAIATMVERRTGYAVLALVHERTAYTMSRAMVKALQPMGRLLKTLTYDNGKEFALHAWVDEQLDTTGYFADPYSSWQRGTNENYNGLLRQYFPKGRNIETITVKELTLVQDKLNNRPRKRLRYKTPAQLLNKSLMRVALRV
jgi:transposase, IS30 family